MRVMLTSTRFVMGALLAAAPVAQQGGNETTAPVFVPDLCADAEGAPPAANLGTTVLLTDLVPGDDYYPVVELLQEKKSPVATVTFEKGSVASARARLGELLPEFVIVVTRPERIDANSHFELLEMAASLDADPFVDFAPGYVTGATADEALEFARRFLKIGKKKNALPKTVFDFGPAKNKTLQEGGPAAHDIAKGWKKTWLYTGAVEEMRERTDRMRGHGVLHAGGHGEPDRVVDGLTARELREQEFDLSPALYFSGPCYCGVTGAWYRPQAGGIARLPVEPMESFALAVIASGVSGLFAGLDPDRLEQAAQELEHLWLHGDALGHAIKSTYDGTAIALRRSKYELFRYEAGKPRPQSSLTMTMVGGGAGRALYGDPTWAPLKKCAKPPYQVKIKKSRKGLKVTCTAKALPKGWSAIDVYRCGGRWTHRIALREKIPAKLAASLSELKVTKLRCKAGDLQGLYPTAMIERWGGETYLHLYVVFEPGGLPQNTRKIEAEFVLS